MRNYRRTSLQVVTEADRVHFESATYKTEAVAKSGQVKCDVKVLSPKIVGNVRGNVESAKNCQRFVELPLKLHYGISLNVSQRDCLAL